MRDIIATEHLAVTIIVVLLIAEEFSTQQCNLGVVDEKIYCEKPSELMIGFKCVDQKCRKTVVSCSNYDDDGDCLTSLDVCKLRCGPTSIWPMPNGRMSISEELTSISFKNERSLTFHSTLHSFENLSQDKTDKLKRLIGGLESKIIRHFTKNKPILVPDSYETKLSITFSLKEPSISFTEKTDESYQLTVTNEGHQTNVKLIGTTFFGVRHASETLLQLLVYDTKSGSFLIPSNVSINDEPVFGYRGLLLDTARSYIPVESIKRTLDGMALNKMNTFHWHLTDTQSFPYVSSKHPEMAKIGAYSENQVYTADDIKEIVEYARNCGIRVLPEFDAPSHVGQGWQHFADQKTGTGYLNCFEFTPWSQYCVEPPCGQLNPTVNGVYDVLADLYREYFEVFDSDLFHMGGDEVSLICWNNTQIMNWIDHSSFKDKGRKDLHELWFYFQRKATEKLETINNGHQRIILWTSGLTKHEEFKARIPPGKHIVQIWEDKSSHHISSLLQMGYDIILSVYDELYLDCGFGNWITDGNNWCSPYAPWQKIYGSDPYVMIEKLGLTVNDRIKKQILGSEAALWSEQADDRNIDNRIWPRVAALAERLWSNPKTGWKQAKSRILYQRERLVSLGIAADALEPTWCLHNDGQCV